MPVSACAERRGALLILGPTGSGKTPLGCHLEKAGFRGRRCVHFDFGENLRDAANSGSDVEDLSETELEVIRKSLRAGTLLEDEHFPIALRILNRFIDRKGIGPDDLIILNGFPRHPGQAVGLASRIAMKMVVILEAGEEIIRDRIRRNAGRDRAGRIDDSEEEIRRKLEIFETRTLPLAGYYKTDGVPVIRIPVGVATGPEEILARIEAEGKGQGV